MKRFIRIAVSGLLIAGCLASAVILWGAFGSNTHAFEDSRGVKIPRGASFEAVTDSLESAGILRRSTSFKLFGRVTGWDRQIKAGYYEFEPGSSNYYMFDRLRKGLQDHIRLTIPPGTRPGVVAAIVRRDLDIDSTSFHQALADTAFLAELGTDRLHAFGYLLPDTYHFFWTIDAFGVIRRIKQHADGFLGTELASAGETELSPDEIVRLASIVQWEARVSEEKPRIAGVYLNRLRIGMPLQADPTVQYAIIDQNGGSLRRLLYVDYEIDHPFNTYRFAGLPPGPITNPSPESIRAVLDAEEHDYLYLVADGNGRHTFSRTLREHNNAARAYQELMRDRRREQAPDAADSQAQ